MGLPQLPQQFRQGGHLPSVYEQTVQSITDAHPPSLGVGDDGPGPLQISRKVNVRMANSRPGFDHGHGGVAAYVRDQSLATAGDDDVH